jgi:cobyrinic acid a,c-diamide synthase
MMARGLIIAAPHSGAGKTTVTLALLAALARRGLTVRAAKAGPDYIDPAFHAAAIGAACVNLDTWAMPRPLLDALAAQSTEGADIFVIEGVMGLFDGASGTAGQRGATADLAAHFGLPVVLVLDVSRQAQSAAAVVRGFAAHDPAVRIAGVILNRVASDKHRALVADAIAALGISVLGAVPREAALALPERHLGLVQAGEHSDLAALIDRLAATAERHLDLDAIAALAAPLKLAAPTALIPAVPPPGQRIALAHDRAFSFVYPHLVNAWRSAGAEIVPFSPLADEPPPERADCCWLPGGYPELHADALAGAGRFMSGLRRFAETRPVHGECGGYMVLGESIEDAAEERHVMAGLLGHSTSFAKRKLHLGYRTAQLFGDGVLGRKGAILRGHEFHYATLTAAGGDECFAELRDGDGRTLGPSGGRRGRVTGTFFHAIAAG